jgi:hypothetical protein
MTDTSSLKSCDASSGLATAARAGGAQGRGDPGGRAVEFAAIGKLSKLSPYLAIARMYLE